jgi:signal transduction histidine kinase
VLGHEPLLTQALANLLGNACKFVREGETPSHCLHQSDRR